MKAVEHLLEVVLKMLASGELVLVVAMAAEEALVLLDRTPSMMMMMMMILGEPQLSAVRRRHFCTERLSDVVLRMQACDELVLVVVVAVAALVLLDRTPPTMTMMMMRMMMMMMMMGDPQLYPLLRRRHFCTERLPEVVLKIQAAYGELVLVAAMAAAALRLLAENPPSPSIYPVPTGMYRRRRRRQIYPSSNRRCLGL